MVSHCGRSWRRIVLPSIKKVERCNSRRPDFFHGQKDSESRSHSTPRNHRHVFRRDSLAGNQPAVLLLQTQVRASTSHPKTEVLTPRPDSIRKPRPSAGTNIMSQASAADKPALSPTLATPPSVQTPQQAPCTSTSRLPSVPTCPHNGGRKSGFPRTTRKPLRPLTTS